MTLTHSKADLAIDSKPELVYLDFIMTTTKTAKQVETFGGILDGTASLVISPLRDGRFAVVRYLPAGMDVGPHVYGRFDTREAAQTCFDSKRTSVAKLVGVTL